MRTAYVTFILHTNEYGFDILNNFFLIETSCIWTKIWPNFPHQSIFVNILQNPFSLSQKPKWNLMCNEIKQNKAEHVCKY